MRGPSCAHALSRPLAREPFALWAVCGLLVLAWLPLGSADRTSCDLATASSAFGEPSRSWFPPGTACTWHDLVGGTTHVDSPTSLRLLVVVAMAIIGPFVSFYLRRLLRANAVEPV